MKKIIALLLLSFLFVSLCACGLTVTSVENTTSQTTVTTQPEESTAPQTTAPVTTQEVTTAETTSLPASTTAPTTTKKQTTTTAPKTITCTVTIQCQTILKNTENLKENKKEFLPTNGVVLEKIKLTLPEGSTAFDAVQTACAKGVCTDNCLYCKRNGVHLDYVYTPGYDSYYIRGIHQLYEKDCGSRSGWMYQVNGVFPNYGCNQYTLKNGDAVTFAYTCDLGDDLGAGQ